MLNQGLTSLPKGLQDISVENRRGLYCILTDYDADTDSKCNVAKQNLSVWLGHAKFQVIYFLPKGDSIIKYYTSFDSLPKSIIQNDIGYSIQIESSNPKKIVVEPHNDNEVNLFFYSDWN